MSGVGGKFYKGGRDEPTRPSVARHVRGRELSPRWTKGRNLKGTRSKRGGGGTGGKKKRRCGPHPEKGSLNEGWGVDERKKRSVWGGGVEKDGTQEW